MRYLLLLSISLLGSAALWGQSIRPQELLSNLAAPGVSGARVNVDLNGDLATVLNRPRSLNGQTVEGYRVYIFNDNGQFARNQAQQTRDRFKSLFPDIPAEIIYNPPPYYKVAVGYCLSKDEVVMIFGRVKGAFPSAFIPNKEPLELRKFLKSYTLSEETTGGTE